MKASPSLIIKTTAVLFFLFFSYLTVKKSLKESSREDFAHYSRVDYWIKSSECTALSKTFLTLCSKDNLTLKPIESGSIADDRGHTLVSNIYGFIYHKPIQKHQLIIFNLLINLIGAFLIFLYILKKNPIPAVFFTLLLLASNNLNLIITPDVIYIYPGLTLISVWAVLEFFENYNNKLFKSLLLICTVFFFGSLFRESIFFATSLGVSGYYLIQTIRFRTKRYVPFFFLGALLFFISKVSNPSILIARDAIWKTDTTNLIRGHGISHNLFIGLGAEKNSWGIKWDDSSADYFAKKVNPNVQYCSEEYYQILTMKYLQFLRENPIESLKIYFLKTLSAAKWLLKELRLPHYLLFLISVIAFFLKKRPSEYAGIIFFIMLGQLLLPVLTIVGIEYLQPAIICWNLLIAIAFQYDEKVILTSYSFHKRKIMKRINSLKKADT